MATHKVAKKNKSDKVKLRAKRNLKRSQNQ